MKRENLEAIRTARANYKSARAKCFMFERAKNGELVKFWKGIANHWRTVLRNLVNP